jgi:hypothetical protein
VRDTKVAELVEAYDCCAVTLVLLPCAGAVCASRCSSISFPFTFKRACEDAPYIDSHACVVCECTCVCVCVFLCACFFIVARVEADLGDVGGRCPSFDRE